jgi:lysophospholipase L1-like esterase
MKKIVLVLSALLFLVSCAPQEKTTVYENPAAVAVTGEGDWWPERHQTIVDRLDTNPEMILIGDSIFHSLDNEDRQEVWTKYLDQYHTVNMGISGDRTENVIWRLQNGSLENINPKLAVILIGTNNTDGNHFLSISTPDELAGGIWKICETVNQKLPETKILLMGILPYGYKSNYRDNINKATNELIAKFPERNPGIHYIDIGNAYLDEQYKVMDKLMPDYLHPNAEGHLLMFQALEEEITRLMKE